jgi:ethanolamine ammonia-lyase small subunit
MDRTVVTADPWRALRSLTGARIALGRAGGSLPTRALLELRLAQARARDAVHKELATTGLVEDLKRRGHEVMVVHSAAADRRGYLLRPDLGRRLDDSSRRILQSAAGKFPPGDAAFVLVDGLSAGAIDRHAMALLDRVTPRLAQQRWTITPLVVVRLGRVAIGDEIAQMLGAHMVVVLIGERPGLSAPDSLGAYLTWRPQPGVTDADRNCVSNIRPEGLAYEQAARTLIELMSQARRSKLTGVRLKAADAPIRIEPPAQQLSAADLLRYQRQSNPQSR